MAEATRVGTPVTQPNHGWVRGTCVRFNGTNWVLATSGVPGVGVVGEVLNANSFVFVTQGAIEDLSGLTPGATYYPGPGGVLSTAVSGLAIGTAYDDVTFFVSQSGASTSQAPTIDVTALATKTEVAAAIANANAADATLDNTRYLHSVDYDGVISVEPGNSGIVFLEIDGTQVLTA